MLNHDVSSSALLMRYQCFCWKLGGCMGLMMWYVWCTCAFREVSVAGLFLVANVGETLTLIWGRMSPTESWNKQSIKAESDQSGFFLFKYLSHSMNRWVWFLIWKRVIINNKYLCAGSPVADRPCRHHSVPAALPGAQYGSFAGTFSAYWHHQ